MTSVLKNNATTTVTTAVSSSDTAITVADGTVFPTLGVGEWFYATMQSLVNQHEIVKVTARTGNSLTVVRGQEDTIAIPFQLGTRIELRVTAQQIYDVATSSTTVVATGATAGMTLADRFAYDELLFEDYGAVGDGSTDDTTAIVNCLAAALSTGVWAKGKPGKTYKTTSTISLASGAKIDIGGTLAPTNANTIKGLAFVGSGTSTTLASSATAGANTIVVTSAASAAVGRYLQLNWVDGTSGETHRLTARIDAISGTTLTISDSVPVAVNSAWSNAVVYFTAGASGIQVRGKIDGAAAGSIRTITGITRANPAVVTYTGTMLVNGETVFIDGVTGMTEVNRTIPTVANVTSTTFELSGVNSSAYTAYTSGGVAVPVCYGLDLQYSVLEDIDVEIVNFPAGCGFRHFHGYGNRHRVKVINCGQQQSKDYSCSGNTGTSAEILSLNAAGSGSRYSANTYSRFSVTNGGGSSAWTYSTGGRGTQAASNLFSRFDLGPTVNAGFTGLGVSNGNSYCSFHGSAIVGSGQNAAIPTTTNGVGIWLSNQYNIGNTFTGFRIAGSSDNDIEVYTTDTLNAFIGCSYDASKVSNLGYADFFDAIPAATIASSATCEIGRATNQFVTVSGVTPITSFGSPPAGKRRTVKFSGALTLTHNATSLILPGAANITTAANDVAELVSLGSGNWHCLSYTRASGHPVVATAVATGGTGAITARGAAANLGMFYVLAQTNVAGPAHTGTVVQTTLATITVPAGAMGANGRLRIHLFVSVNSDASAKTVRIKLGGTTMWSNNAASVVAEGVQIVIGNRNSVSSQIGGITSPSGLSTSASALSTGAINTANAADITITGELADAADTLTLEGYLVELFYAA